ncbi:TPA: hypothetical protein ACQGQ1_000915 [Pseudomonas aeruginosa]|uniref:hypothetical protein n=1 Tax=Pseudomonas aeruginosa TaxID=287 RepID=UPI000F5286A1|nr:hypothetical protein [Pseudomonas aeruginosa]MBA5053202.1 hypothetical protein [Pseudomonas aeruginosa]
MKNRPIPAGVEINPGRAWTPDDVTGYSEEVESAIKVLEPLLRSGLLALHPDEWQGGKLSFLRPAQAKLQGWTSPNPERLNA